MEPVIKADRIVLHVGAHRTGTGSFQSFLNHNAAKLQGAGISARYPGRDIGDEGTLKLKLPAAEDIKIGGVKDRHVVAARRQLLAGETTGEMIISEENILGRMIPIFKGRFYYRIIPRMEILANAMGRAPDQVVMVVRNYGDFFVSAYAQMAQVRVMPAWDIVMPRLLQNERTWGTVACALHKGLNPTRITVVPYAKRGTNADLLALMTKTKIDGLQEVPRGTNTSATSEAIFELQARLAAKEELSEETVQQIKDDHSVANGGTVYNPMTPAQKSTFTRRYNADLKAMQDDTSIDYAG